MCTDYFARKPGAGTQNEIPMQINVAVVWYAGTLLVTEDHLKPPRTDRTYPLRRIKDK